LSLKGRAIKCRPSGCIQPTLKGQGDDMNKLSFNAVLFTAAVAAFAGEASAADLPAAAPAYKTPAPVVSPVFNWTGFYVGANVGYGWSGNDDGVRFTDFPTGSFANTFAIGQTPQAIGFRQKGVIGGAELGYNWQTGALVLGVEGDFSGANIKGSGSFAFTGPLVLGAPETTTASSSLDWLATVRGRIGFTPADRLLIFGTGGVAFGQVNNQSSIVAANPPGFPTFVATLNGNQNSTRTGWVAGAGAQYAITNQVFAKLEWLHYDLGTSSVSANEILNGVTQPFGLNSSFKTNGNIVRFGVDYRFGGLSW
jgi:outer membrane immunogenic protein